jgi:hypothetical protein
LHVIAEIQMIFRRRSVSKVQRREWRMSSTNPVGEFLDPWDRPTARGAAREVHEPGFRASSDELATGSDVTEADMDRLPGDLVAAFANDGR